MLPPVKLDSAVLAALMIGCSSSATPLDPPSTGTDAGADPVADDAAVPLSCEDGFELDEQQRCANWRPLTDGAPTCFDTSLLTLNHGGVLVVGNCHDAAAPEPSLLSGFIFEPDTGAWR